MMNEKVMTFQNIKDEFNFILKEYQTECDRNKGYADTRGHEGTVESFRLLSRLNLIQYFAKQYFDETLEFERMIF